MDSDFLTARLAAAKRQFNTQHHHQLSHGRTSSRLDRFTVDDVEVEEEIRPDYPCPYCYEEFDIASLCLHLDDEHSYESKPTVCSICSVNIASDMLTHITLQHGHLLKLQRQKRLHKVPIANSQALSLLGKDLRETHLHVLLGGTGFRSNSATSSTSSSNVPTTDFLNFFADNTDEISKSILSSIEENSSRHLSKSSFVSSLSREEQEQRKRQEAGRTIFIQDLVFSTLLAD